MTSETIRLRDARLEIMDGVAEFTHDRPERRNPTSPELRRDYQDMLDRIEPDPAIRALILTGSGGVFCAGGDLRNLRDRVENPDAEQNSAAAMRRRMLDTHAWFGRLRNLELPVIAAVDGPAMGAGMSLALAADFILASRRAGFAMSFARMGLVPDTAAAYLLPRLVGMAAAKDLMLTARRIGAEEAREMGIVHSIHEPDALLPQARRFARRFVDGPPQAFGAIKHMLNSTFETSSTQAVALEANAQAVASTTAYHADAVRRFARGEPLRYDWDRASRNAGD
jgi:2-(1,2-epoxy-1,2-dihydrophenyl)acetyl-CoA isomerase